MHGPMYIETKMCLLRLPAGTCVVIVIELERVPVCMTWLMPPAVYCFKDELLS